MLEHLLSQEVQRFIQEHQHESPAQLMLQRDRFPHLAMKEIVAQIQGLQKARKKLPLWASTPQILYEPLALEQCSSQFTAHFKATSILDQANKLVDLSGGFGVDTYFFAENCAKEVVHVEPNTQLQEMVKHNLRQMGQKNISFLNLSAEEALHKNLDTDIFYIDPSRRDAQNRRVFFLEDTLPPVLELLDLMGRQAAQVIIKCAPMLDIHQAWTSLNRVLKSASVNRVYVLSLQNEVKEVLFYLSHIVQSEPKILAIELEHSDTSFDFSPSEERQATVQFASPLDYLIEPNAAILKAGAFKSFATQQSLYKLHPSSHLYTTEAKNLEALRGLGRFFRIHHICRYQKKEVLKYLPKKQANISTRNFPDSVAQVRKKLQLKEGGDQYLFATTDLNHQKIILITQKINP